jgi:hypothetical protein
MAAYAIDPLHLRPEASLNRTVIAPVLGADRRLVGRPAFELLSVSALTRLALCAGFAPEGANPDIILALSSALAGDDQTSAAAAVRVLDLFGARVAHLIATLTTAAHSHAGESAWRSAYLRHWMEIDHVWLGGGLAAAFGSTLLNAVRAELARLGVGDRIVELAPYAAVLPLVGASRSGTDTATPMIVLDFGHTSVKRGVATVANHQLVRLDLLTRRSTQPLNSSPAPEQVADFVLETVMDAITTTERRFGSAHGHIVVSVASYVARGRPIAAGPSKYRPLSDVDIAWLDDELYRRAGNEFHLLFLHDGTAAARGLNAAGGRDAVIMLGTSLGVGFPPPAETLLPVAPEFFVAS